MNEFTYTKNGDYYIPDLTINKQNRPIGRYGRLRKAFLCDFNTTLYNQMILSDELYSHLLEIDDAAEERMARIIPELAKAQGVTEALKAADQMKWVGLMNNIRLQAEEIVLNELVYI